MIINHSVLKGNDMGISRTEAIKLFLSASAKEDLANLYHFGMECQINVAEDGGERIKGEFKGRKWQGWSDGFTTWKPFRIPYDAKGTPHYDDPEMKFDLAAHAEGIGMTGWDWQAKRSRWVAYDFDSIIGHSEKHKATLTNVEMQEIQDCLTGIDWVTIRKSTGGNGLHVYVHLDICDEVENHTEHAALARAILGQLSAITGHPLSAKVDICGGNMWVWHRKSKGTQGLEILKQGTVLCEAPSNWRDHLKVVKGSNKKRIPKDIEALGKLSAFEELSGQHPRSDLDEDHKKLLKYLQDEGLEWEWDQDNHMLITHSNALGQAYRDLNLIGFYQSNSSGSSTVNCFAFPMRRGSWVVRRYSTGVAEHSSWEQDGAGWTRCYLNREPDLATISRSMGGIEQAKGGFVFREAETAASAALHLGATLNIAPALSSRKTTFKSHKDGRLVVEIERQPEDSGDQVPGFLAEKSKWVRIFNTKTVESVEPEGGIFDDILRHLVGINSADAGWVLNSDSKWHDEPLTHVRAALTSTGMSSKELNQTIGGSVFKPWKLVNKPFQPEYPGDREWNRESAQLRYMPSQGDDFHYPTWTKILNHCGSGLNEAIQKNPWCIANGITCGGEYLKCWVASIIQEPEEPLPYLFFYNEQQATGKSTFHESLSLLFTRGVAKAGSALTNQQGFNGELAGSVISTVEEVDLSQSKVAYNRVKDWVTGREILIHPKGGTPYSTVNTTHWIQCANSILYCPIFPGDTRITICFVPQLNPMDMIPGKRLVPLLEKEAPDFLGELMALEIPESDDRLNVPVVSTDDKLVAEKLNLNPLEIFIQEHCATCNGNTIKMSEFYDKFVSVAFSDDASKWSKIKVGKLMPRKYPKGRSPKDPNWYLGNIRWASEAIEPTKPLVLVEDFLREVDSD